MTFSTSSPLPRLFHPLALLLAVSVAGACDDTDGSDESGDDSEAALSSDSVSKFRNAACEYFNEVVSVDHLGTANHTERATSTDISSDGKVVAFISSAVLVPDAAHPTDPDRRDKLVFVRDLETGVTQLVSRDVNGARPTGSPEAGNVKVSGDGSLVVYLDRDQTLFPPGEDADVVQDVIARERGGTQNELISVSPTGTNLDALADNPVVGFSGRYVAFGSKGAYDSTAANPPEYPVKQIFVRDRVLQTTLLVSQRNVNSPAHASSRVMAILGSESAPQILFSSEDANLDGSGAMVGGAFVRDLSQPAPVRVSFDENHQPIALAGGNLVTGSADANHFYYVTARGVFHYDRSLDQARRLPISDCDKGQCLVETNAHYLPDGSFGPGDGTHLFAKSQPGGLLLDVARNIGIVPLRHPDGSPMDLDRAEFGIAGDATALTWLSHDDGGGATPDSNNVPDVYVRKLFPEWGPALYYNPGDLVSFYNDLPANTDQVFEPSTGVPRLNGLHYRTVQFHRSQDDWAPDRELSMWERISECGAAPIISSWIVGFNYLPGESVDYQGTTYTCIQGHISQSDWTPDVTPALWQAN